MDFHQILDAVYFSIGRAIRLFAARQLDKIQDIRVSIPIEAVQVRVVLKAQAPS